MKKREKSTSIYNGKYLYEHYLPKIEVSMSWCDEVTTDGSSCFLSPIYTMYIWNSTKTFSAIDITPRKKQSEFCGRGTCVLPCSTHSLKEAAA
jgi:hypothetical protein